MFDDNDNMVALVGTVAYNKKFATSPELGAKVKVYCKVVEGTIIDIRVLSGNVMSISSDLQINLDVKHSKSLTLRISNSLTNINFTDEMSPTYEAYVEIEKELWDGVEGLGST